MSATTPWQRFAVLTLPQRRDWLGSMGRKSGQSGVTARGVFLTFALFGVFSLGLSVCSAQTPRSPVGIWELTISGRDKGTVWVEFYSDSTLVGYGMSLNTPGFFVVTGSWFQDSKGTTQGQVRLETGNSPQAGVAFEFTGALTGVFTAKART